MSKPIVAVVGRPNVGKSTLFNKLCGQRLAIVEDTPGITRDRIFANCEWSGHEFLLVDTGGIEPKATEGILAHMREQAQIAIDTADCIIMVVDVRNGLTAADEDVAHMLRRSHKPTLQTSSSAVRLFCRQVSSTSTKKQESVRLSECLQVRLQWRQSVWFSTHSCLFRSTRHLCRLQKLSKWDRQFSLQLTAHLHSACTA